MKETIKVRYIGGGWTDNPTSDYNQRTFKLIKGKVYDATLSGHDQYHMVGDGINNAGVYEYTKYFEVVSDIPEVSLEISFPKEPAKPLLSRCEILKKDGIYSDGDQKIRFVVVSGICFVFGDVCKLYQSANFNIHQPKYYEVNEKIQFIKN